MGTTVFERARPSEAAVDHALAASRHAVFWLEDAGPGPGIRSSRARSRPTSRSSAAATPACGRPCCAKDRDPDAGSSSSRPKRRLGGIRPQRRLRRGEPHPRRRERRSRWPDELEHLTRSACRTSTTSSATVAATRWTCDFERTGTLDLAIEQHQLESLRRRPPSSRDDEPSSTRTPSAARSTPPPTSPALGQAQHRPGAPREARARAGAGRPELGVKIFENSPVPRSPARLPDGRLAVLTAALRVSAARVALATNVFPILLKRNRLRRCPSTTTS